MNEQFHFKASRSIGWFKSKIESLEDDFVQLIVSSCVFTRGKESTGFTNSLNEEECKLMDDILELKDWINEMLEEKTIEEKERARGIGLEKETTTQ